MLGPNAQIKHRGEMRRSCDQTRCGGHGGGAQRNSNRTRHNGNNGGGQRASIKLDMIDVVVEHKKSRSN